MGIKNAVASIKIWYKPNTTTVKFKNLIEKDCKAQTIGVIFSSTINGNGNTRLFWRKFTAHNPPTLW